jgi:hypothetical protein
MSLHVLAYNIKRVIAIFGVGPLMAAILIVSFKLHTPNIDLPTSRPSRRKHSASTAPPTRFPTASPVCGY